MANVSGTAELGVLPSNICNKASGSAQTAVEHHTIHECENVALVACHEKPKTARKRRSCHGTEMEKSLNGTNLKKVRNHGLRIRSTTTKHLSSAFANEVNQGFCGKYVKKPIKDCSFTVCFSLKKKDCSFTMSKRKKQFSNVFGSSTCNV